MRFHWGNSLRYGAALGVLVVGILLSLYAGQLVRQWHGTMVRASFSHLMQLYVNSIDASLNRVNDNLQALRDYMDASGVLKRHEFDLFTSSLLSRYPEIDAVMWVPRLRRQQLGSLSQLDAAVRRRHLPEGAAPSAGVWPVQMVTPTSSAPQWLGVDARIHPLLRDALRKARGVTEPASSYAFARDGGSQRDGFMITVDVPSAIEVGRTEGRPIVAKGGFVVGLISIPMLIERATRDFATGFTRFYLYDSADNLLGSYGDDVTESGDALKSTANSAATGSLVRTLRLDVADREWRLVGRPANAFPMPRSPWEASAVVIIGSLFSLISAAYLASVTGEMISRRSAERRLRAVVKYDGLTGLKTRMEFFRELPDEWERAVRYGHELSIVMIDLDYFKAINDTYGHPAGDRVLSEVGGVIIHHVRASDVAARYGGEEFIIILSETDRSDAAQLAERIHAEIGRLRIDVDGGRTLSVSATIGIASRDESLKSPKELVRRADIALYRGKAEGRDCIRFFDSPEDERAG